MTEDEEISKKEEIHSKAKELVVSIHLNLALVYLKTKPELYFEAKENATKALKFDPDNVKGLFRRGQALLGLGEAEEALKDFQSVLKTEPQNKVNEFTHLSLTFNT